MHPEELVKRIKINHAPAIIDARHGFEYHKGHIPGAIHAPTLKILFRMAHIPADKHAELVVTCEHGPRAQIVGTLLRALGYRNVTLLEGHMARWRQSGHPQER